MRGERVMKGGRRGVVREVRGEVLGKVRRRKVGEG